MARPEYMDTYREEPVLFETGGSVRNKYMAQFGHVVPPSNDLDLSVQMPEGQGYPEMVQYLKDKGFKLYMEKPEFQTVRARVPDGHPWRKKVADADFVMCRKDGTYSDGRHPDSVEPGTMWDDLKRRDFTVNAMALDMEGRLFDPFNGLIDCKNRVLRFVGKPEERLKEDGMRVLRALRFSVTHNLRMPSETFEAVAASAYMLECVPVDRMRSELNKMFAHDTVYALDMLKRFPGFSSRLFRDGMRLEATLKGKGSKKGKKK